MKFKFCAEGDCPLWALAALHALSALPAPLFRALVQVAVDEDEDDDRAMELLKDTSLASRAESARAIASLRWVLTSAWSCGCAGSVLARDLAVLGMGRPLAAALAEAADQHRDSYVDGLNTHGFAVNKLTDITVSAAPVGTMDSHKLTLHSERLGEESRTELLIDTTQARDLLQQLKIAYAKMLEMEVEK